MVTTPLCGRVGCAEAAVGVLLIASQECQAWLVELTHEAAPEGVALCAHHADRIRVPVGWTLTDQRPATSPTKRRRKRKASAAPVAESPVVEEPSEEPVPTPPPAEDAPVDEDPAAAAPSEAADPVAAALPDADSVAAALPDDDPRHLQVVPVPEQPAATVVFEESGQGALWVPPPDEHDELEASDQTPLLKRAFRVVRED